MTRLEQNTTAKLAAAFGLLLLTADSEGKAAGKLDSKKARELSVLSRVLEKRLADTRAFLSAAVENESRAFALPCAEK
jgi:hypothetical protein